MSDHTETPQEEERRLNVVQQTAKNFTTAVKDIGRAIKEGDAKKTKQEAATLIASMNISNSLVATEKTLAKIKSDLKTAETEGNKVSIEKHKKEMEAYQRVVKTMRDSTVKEALAKYKKGEALEDDKATDALIKTLRENQDALETLSNQRTVDPNKVVKETLSTINDVGLDPKFRRDIAKELTDSLLSDPRFSGNYDLSQLKGELESGNVSDAQWAEKIVKPLNNLYKSLEVQNKNLSSFDELKKMAVEAPKQNNELMKEMVKELLKDTTLSEAQSEHLERLSTQLETTSFGKKERKAITDSIKSLQATGKNSLRALTLRGVEEKVSDTAVTNKEELGEKLKTMRSDQLAAKHSGAVGIAQASWKVAASTMGLGPLEHAIEELTGKGTIEHIMEVPKYAEKVKESITDFARWFTSNKFVKSLTKAMGSGLKKLFDPILTTLKKGFASIKSKFMDTKLGKFLGVKTNAIKDYASKKLGKLTNIFKRDPAPVNPDSPVPDSTTSTTDRVREERIRETERIKEEEKARKKMERRARAREKLEAKRKIKRDEKIEALKAKAGKVLSKGKSVLGRGKNALGRGASRVGSTLMKGGRSAIGGAARLGGAAASGLGSLAQGAGTVLGGIGAGTLAAGTAAAAGLGTAGYAAYKFAKGEDASNWASNLANNVTGGDENNTIGSRVYDYFHGDDTKTSTADTVNNMKPIVASPINNSTKGNSTSINNSTIGSATPINNSTVGSNSTNVTPGTVENVSTHIDNSAAVATRNSAKIAAQETVAASKVANAPAKTTSGVKSGGTKMGGGGSKGTSGTGSFSPKCIDDYGLALLNSFIFT